MAWKLNKTLLLGSDEQKQINLAKSVGDTLISEMVTGFDGEFLDYIKLINGLYVYNSGTGVLLTETKPTPSYWLMSHGRWKDYFIEVEEDVQNISVPIREYYLFGDTKYFDKEELLAAIGDCAGKDGGTYYYTHHIEKEYCVEVDNKEKVMGEYDQSTLDKVNEILKMKGINFVIKGEQQ